MSIDGQLRMLPEEARQRAKTIRSDADNMETLLNDVRKRLEIINDESLGTYHGAKKPSEIRAELDAFAATFSKFYSQITKFAGDIETAANMAENE
jgi:hypothetical protein